MLFVTGFHITLYTKTKTYTVKIFAFIFFSVLLATSVSAFVEILQSLQNPMKF